MFSLKTIAVTGAAGSLGKVVLDKLVSSGKFDVTVLRRTGSKSTYPSSLKVVDVDYDSVDDLTKVLKDQDAVVSLVGATGVAGQAKLVDAAAAAGVQRFIPSEFGSNLDNPNARQLPVFAEKVKIQDALAERAKTSQLTYTYIYTSAFLDFGIQYNFLLDASEYRPAIYDGGDGVFSATTLPTIGDAVVGVLLHPEETKNRAVFTESIKITQNKLLSISRQVAPGKPWDPQPTKLHDVVSVAYSRLAQKLFDAATFIPFIYRALFDPTYGANFEKTDNALLGLKEVTEEDVVEIVRQHLSKA